MDMFSQLSTYLTESEQDVLAQCESIIERGLKSFIEVGTALVAIRDNQLYRRVYPTFESYCQDKWSISRPRAYELMNAAGIVEYLSANGIQEYPSNERQARPLSRVEPEVRAELWQSVLDTAPNGKVTAEHVEKVVEDYQGRTMKPKSNYTSGIYTPQGMDACQTPPYAIDPILPYLDQRWTLWEPAAGELYLVNAFYDAGFHQNQIIASDIITGQNFFDFAPDQGWDCLVTNPPYGIKYDWLERCYEFDKPFALLLPLETLGAKAAQNLFKQYGVEIVLMDKRVDFKMPEKGWEGSAQFPTAWFTWGLEIGSQLTFSTINKDWKE